MAGSQKNVSPFDVLKEMGRRELDIREFSLWDNLKSVRIDGKNGVLVMYIDPGTATDIITEKPLVAMLIVADSAQFNELKTELENQ